MTASTMETPIWALSRSLGRRTHAGLLAALVVNLVATVSAFLAPVALLRMASGGDPGTAGVTAGLCILGSLLAGITADLLAHQAQQKIAATVERTVWRRMLSQPLVLVQQRSLREVLGAVAAVGLVRGLVGAFGIEIILSVVSAVAATWVLAVVDPILALVAGGVVLVALVVVFLLSRAQSHHDREVMSGVESAHATIYPALVGVDEMQTYRAQGLVMGQWSQAFARQKDADAAGLRYGNASAAVLLSLQAILLAVLLPLVLTLRPAVGPGLVVVVVMHLSATAARLAAAIPELFAATLVRQRLAEVTRPADAVGSGTRAPAPVVPWGRVVEGGDVPVSVPGVGAAALALEAVSFRFPQSVEDVLHEVELRAEPGEFVAVVGGSGAGKSTLLRVILGLYQPTSGAVRIDGVDGNHWDPAALRAQFGYVPQAGAPTRGSLRDLLQGHAPKASDDDLLAAADGAGIGEFIRSLPLGLDTRVGDSNSGFSGGEEQRLLLARALVRKPRILVLDEATSALDEDTQAIVAGSVAALAITRIVVAHRFSTIAQADRVLALQRGRVTYFGPRAGWSPPSAPPPRQLAFEALHAAPFRKDSR